jgi:hypothetical protein
LNNGNAPRLTVAAARSKARIIKNCMQYLVVNNLIGKTTNGTRCSDAVA